MYLLNKLLHLLPIQFSVTSLPHSASPNNMRTKKLLLKKSFRLKEPGAVTSSFRWRRTTGPLRRADQFEGPSSSCVYTQCLRQTHLPIIFQTTSSLEASDMEVKPSRNCSRSRGARPEVSGFFSTYFAKLEHRKYLRNYWGDRSMGNCN